MSVGATRGADRSARLREPLALGAAAVAAAFAAFFAAALGIKGVVAAATALALVALFVLARGHRPTVLLGGLVAAFVVLQHKTIGPEATHVDSGALGFSISSVDVVILCCYASWAAAGTMARDVLRALRRPVVWVPLAGLLLMSLSVLDARRPYLTFAELFRLGWVYLLFLYAGARVRTRREVAVVLGALGAFAAIQLVVSVLQWRTGGVLGLGFLGVPTKLTQRTLDVGELGRPFGTLIHPVFLGAVLGSIGLMALSVAVHVRDRRVRRWSLAVLPCCILPMALAHTRSAGIAFVVATVVLVAVSLARHRLSTRELVVAGVAVLVVVLLLWPQVATLVHENFGTRHFSVEVTSRTQLNHVGYRMFRSSPVIGTGLDNFTQIMNGFVHEPLLYPGFPSHNLFVLQAAETGVLGVLALLLVGGALVAAAWKLSRSRDGLHAAVGTGVLCMYVFYAVEEQLSYSLREEVPLGVFWLLAGLTVACLRMEGEGDARPRPRARRARPGTAGRLRHPTPPGGRTRPRARKRPRARALLAVATLLPAGVWLGTGAAAATPSTAGLQIVFSAIDRAHPHGQGIYEADAATGAVHRITPDDGAIYSWPSWAMNGTKIVYTRRTGSPGAPEDVFLADPDGSHAIRLLHSTWRVDQPKVSADGRTVVFASFWPESPVVNLMETDLASLQTTNVSVVANGTKPAFDSDPKWTDDGRIVFAHSLDGKGHVAPTAVWIMNADGTGAHALTHDAYFDVDPELSPDGSTVAFGSYRGPDHPATIETTGDPSHVKTNDWHLVTIDVHTGTTRVLTEGQRCADARRPCTPAQGSAGEPNWTPDGKEIGYVSVESPTHVCICVVGADGTGAREVVASDTLAINWFNWSRPGIAPATRVPDAGIGATVPSARILYGGGSSAPGVAGFGWSGDDRYGDNAITLPDGLQPRTAHWSSDHRIVVFSAATPYDPNAFRPAPPPPPGATRHVHFTLDELQRTWVPPDSPPPGFADEQVFLYDRATGALHQLTTPWTEDYMDALRPGDAHANRDPDISPDGRAVVFTNVAADGESAVLRLDLADGSVYSLTNGTAGAVPVADAEPRFSPDGSLVAFRTSVGADTEIWTMRASDGHIVRRLTDDHDVNLTPSWSPDGREVVYSSFRGPGPGTHADGGIDLGHWSIVAVDVTTGSTRVVTATDGVGAFKPEFSPDGRRVAFVAIGGAGRPDIYVVPAGGGTARPLQVTFLTSESFFDWK